MRIWSLHPKYLDAKGLVALWRETLLAKNVLEGNTKGYIHHPQLIRFKKADNPLLAINAYLETVYTESVSRGYRFDRCKFKPISGAIQLPLTKGQLYFEWRHLLGKLKSRDFERYQKFENLQEIDINPVFYLVDGEVKAWEKVRLEDTP